MVREETLKHVFIVQSVLAKIPLGVQAPSVLVCAQGLSLCSLSSMPPFLSTLTAPIMRNGNSDVNTCNAMAHQNLYVLKQCSFYLCSSPRHLFNAGCLVIHHAGSFTGVPTNPSFQRLKSWYRASLMMTANVSLMQTMQENVNNNFFSGWVSFSIWNVMT